MTLNTASGISCVTGVFIFGMGVSGTILLAYSTLAINIANAIVPFMSEKNLKKIGDSPDVAQHSNIAIESRSLLTISVGYYHLFIYITMEVN
ncbi:MAG: hypothetical protein DRR16_11910 [Candidatus Parabeggiatoa sp. nov. 3]|nr:MAG: hypothetical protein DRR00_32590 [Gammaproteobacteria bacterium]RKZ67076.1 MAG: hypothetical protein DRQ99_07685 [Gammaproteobacteria bacterium]RKZ85512.1 MAG: hypothetical protein DRR16_11910 [Gammaproteobacteria bacterium]